MSFLDRFYFIVKMQIFKNLVSFLLAKEIKSRQAKELNKGFTLLELLIVIAILATLATIVVLVLNPAETLKKSRDTQRMSDMSSLKSAIGLYATTVTPVYLAGAASNAACQVGVNGWTGETASGLIYYSVSSGTDGEDITDLTLDGSTFTSTGNSQTADLATGALTDGTGWIPIKFDNITGGSPISGLPVDPINDISYGTSAASTMTSEALVYRYACNTDNLTYEINATLESAEMTTAPNDRRTKDGGNSLLMYEVGTNLKILGVNNATTVSTAGF